VQLLKVPLHCFVALHQVDQMRLWKSRIKCSPLHLVWKLLRRFCRGKSSPIISATSAIFKNYPK
jgi:hypothetical protein